MTGRGSFRAQRGKPVKFPAWLPSVLALAALLIGPPAARAAPGAAGVAPVFSGEEAQRWIVRQCALGPRVPGTAAHAAWLKMVHGYLDSLKLEVRTERFQMPRPAGPGREVLPDPLVLTNLLVSVRPGVRPRLLLGAHWDSRPWADEDPDPAKHNQPVLGANDGASGVAVLLVLARLLAETPPSMGVDLAFFDGEDLGKHDKPEEYCLGSQRMAANWAGPPPDWVLVLDMVGSETLEMGREYHSWNQAPELVELIFRVAREKGFSQWNWDTQLAVIDDHIPFQRLGVPAAVLIGFNDPVWHTVKDVPERTSARALGRVGEVVSTLIYGGYFVPE